MHGTIESRMLRVGFVALHAAGARFFLRRALEREYLGLVPARLHVRGAGPMTGFARVPWLAATVLKSSFVVRTSFDLLELGLMTSLAGVRTYV